jgi:UDP-N-acetylmuramoyl-tripeptide--D-alanyl-D-alanine ligase
LENYSSQAELVKEKLSILKGLKKNGTCVANIDSENILKSIDRRRYNFLTYGLNNESDFMASEVLLTQSAGDYGLNFKILHKGTTVPVFIPHTLGGPVAYSALAAAAVGWQFGMNMVDVTTSFRNFSGPSGRLRLLPGIKNTIIIDDSYNAAPESTIAAIKVIKSIGKGRLLAAIGEMAELGAQTDPGHRQVARSLHEAGVQAVFLVGEKTKIIEDELRAIVFKGKIFWFKDSNSAKLAVQDELKENDTILVKGSQSARMEKVVLEIMRFPEDAKKLLVRQGQEWADKLY